MYKAYQQYVDECERSSIEPLSFQEWNVLDDMVD